MNIALCSALWGRFDLARVWWKGINRVKQQFHQRKFGARIFIACSEVQHLQGARLSGVIPIEHENKPLGKKLNEVVGAALYEGYDYICILGMDDFFSPLLVERYCDTIEKSHPLYFGLRGMYLYEPSTARMMLFQTDAKGNYPKTNPDDSTVRRLKRTPLGAGRMIHRSLFEGHKYFWAPDKNQGLDASLTATLRLPSASTLIPADSKCFALDVKTKDNIWSFSHLAETFPACVLDTPHDLSMLPEWPEIQAL